MDEAADRDRQTVDATRAVLVAGPVALLLALGIAWLVGWDRFSTPWLLATWGLLTVALAAVPLRRRR